MAWIARTSGGVSRDGDVRGQDDGSSSAHACCRRRQAWNRLGDTRRNRKRVRNSPPDQAARRWRHRGDPRGRGSPSSLRTPRGLNSRRHSRSAPTDRHTGCQDTRQPSHPRGRPRRSRHARSHPLLDTRQDDVRNDFGICQPAPESTASTSGSHSYSGGSFIHWSSALSWRTELFGLKT
jgi:hypothetical protein